jgi:predicted alpha/beta-hydrolase family hydrolase
LIAEAFAQAGFGVLRYDLPFRQRKRFGPPFGTAAEDRRGLSDAARELRSSAGLRRLYFGGHSYGGRQASILAVEEPGICDGLLLLSYPLHPPKRPQDLRTDHFRDLQTRTIFVHGTEDPFGSVEELKSAAELIPGVTLIEEVRGAGHDLGKGKLELGARIIASFVRMFDSAPGVS